MLYHRFFKPAVALLAIVSFYPVSGWSQFTPETCTNLSVPVQRIYYVSPTGGANGGTALNPAGLVPIMDALNAGTLQADELRLAVGNYTLTQKLVIPSNIHISGGYIQQTPGVWVKSNLQKTRLIRTNQNNELTPNRIVGLEAIGKSNFEISDLDIEVQNADTLVNGFGCTLYGIYLNGSSNYLINRCKVRTGNGTDGQKALPGATGSDGVKGVDGGLGCRQCAPDSVTQGVLFTNKGGSGGQSWSSGVGNSSGGTGGNGGVPGPGVALQAPVNPFNFSICNDALYFANNVNPTNGANGEGLGPVAGGLGGQAPAKNYRPAEDPDLGCPTSVFNIGELVGYGAQALDGLLDGCQGSAFAFKGQNGFDAPTPGAPGNDGQNGAPDYASGFFVPGDGQNGQNGQDGGGGGGGGGGAGVGGQPCVDPFGTCTPPRPSIGAGGGGGGEGGQGGQGGQGGGGGGGTFAVFVWNNGPNSRITDTEMLVGFAGKGQQGNIGGNGGAGGAGGKGGNAAAIVGNGSIGTCSSDPNATQVINGVTYRCHSGCYMGAGGDGGKGSAGGKGGSGGKGSDGVANPFFQNFTGDAVIVTNQAVSFEPKIQVLNPSDCVNGTIEYAVTNPVPNTIYEWSFGGDAKPATVSGPTASVIYSQAGNKKVILTVDGLSYTYSNYIGLASPGYFPKISLPNNGQTLYCQNETISFGSLVTRSGVAAQVDVTQYDWILTRPDGSTDNVSNTSLSYPASGSLVLSDTGIYKLKLRIRTNCCGFSDYDSVSVRVVKSFDKPIINLIRLQNETCEGVPVTYQLNLIPPTTPDGSPYQIFWSVDGVLVPSNNGQTSLTVDPAQGFNTTKNVSVVVGSSFPCLTLTGPGDWDPSSSTTTTSFPVVVLPGVTIAPSPSLDNTNIILTNGLCNGLIDNVLLGTPSVVNFSVTQGAFPVQATVRYGVELGGGQFVFFSQDNSIIFDGNPVTFDELFGSPGEYIIEITLVDAKGCTFTCYRRAKVEPINQLPAIDFSITSPSNPTPGLENIVEACGEAKIRVTGRVIGDVGTVPVAYFFDFGNGQTDTLPPTPNQTSYTTPEITYGPGIYSIETRIWIGTQLYSRTKQNLVKVYQNPRANIVELARDNCEGRPRKLAGSDENTAGYLWDLGDGQTSTLPVVDFTRPPGTYTVGLKVTNFNGLCSAETTATIVIEPRPIPAIAATQPLKACRQVRLQTENISSGNGGTLEFSSVDLGDQTLLENPTVIDHVYTVPGVYSITIKARNASGCDSTVLLKDFITVFEQSEALFTPLAEFDTLIADSGIYVIEPPNTQVIFRNESRGYSTFEWSINGELITGVESPTRDFTETGDYPIRLITRSKDGCPDTAYAVIRVRESNVFEIPNVFSPNADNINDLFEIKNIGWDYDIAIYNRWGNQIFIGNQDKPWDGTVNNGGQKCQEGVYIYYIKAKFRKNPLRGLEKSGSVTLIR